MQLRERELHPNVYCPTVINRDKLQGALSFALTDIDQDNPLYRMLNSGQVNVNYYDLLRMIVRESEQKNTIPTHLPTSLSLFIQSFEDTIPDTEELSLLPFGLTLEVDKLDYYDEVIALIDLYEEYTGEVFVSADDIQSISALQSYPQSSPPPALYDSKPPKRKGPPPPGGQPHRRTRQLYKVRRARRRAKYSSRKH